MPHTYYLFRPSEESQVLEYLPNPIKCPEWTFVHDATQRDWYVRDTKQPRWLRIVDAGVPENYRLELLLLQATHS